MWLVAPHIPHAVREFLDRIGIEYSEIHEVQFRRVADRYGIAIQSPNREPVRPQASGAGRLHQRRAAEGVSHESYRLLASIDKRGIAALINEFEGAVKRRVDIGLAVKLRKQVLDATVASVDHATMMQLAKWCKTEGPVYWGGMAVAQKIGADLFGVVLDRKHFGT